LCRDKSKYRLGKFKKWKFAHSYTSSKVKYLITHQIQVKHEQQQHNFSSFAQVYP
jgi:hypothetical protein